MVGQTGALISDNSGDPVWFYPPSAAAKTDNGNSVVYASWNGSTQTRAWRVLSQVLRRRDPDLLKADR
ncbi:hypothetical protein [Streptomyces sp. NPDC001410]|uniref:hypothetical protein n=1 Tax=Streptomyces sp. NPDC001410 TaxID=3364574 RepID=UPI0036AAAD9F